MFLIGCLENSALASEVSRETYSGIALEIIGEIGHTMFHVKHAMGDGSS